MSKNSPAVINKIQKIEATTGEPLPPVEVLRRNLIYKMMDSITDMDMHDITRKVISKARKGDYKATKLWLEMIKITGGDRQASVTHMQQAIVSGDNQKREVEFISELRRQMVVLIDAEGPLQSVVIAAKIHVELRDVCYALDHEWFERRNDGYHITDEARTWLPPHVVLEKPHASND